MVVDEASRDAHRLWRRAERGELPMFLREIRILLDAKISAGQFQISRNTSKLCEKVAGSNFLRSIRRIGSFCDTESPGTVVNRDTSVQLMSRRPISYVTLRRSVPLFRTRYTPTYQGRRSVDNFGETWSF